MAELVTTIEADSEHLAKPVDPTSAHLQTTISPELLEDAEAKPPTSNKYPDGLQNDTTLRRPSRSPRTSPQSASPERAPAPYAPKLYSVLKSAQRLADASSVEHSPVAPRMSTVPEDQVPEIHIGRQTPARKSVQFSRDAEDKEQAETPKENGTPVEGEKTDGARPQSLYSRLRALATSQGLTHVRSTSGISVSGRSLDNRDPDSAISRNETAFPATIEQDHSDADADEESAAEGALSASVPRKKRRRVRREHEAETAPSSPNSPMRPGFLSAQTSRQASSSSRPHMLHRSATDTDMPARNQGVSEDEGRRQLSPSPAWTPKHPLRGLSYGGQRKPEEGTPEGREGRRPMLLNLSNIGSHRGEPSGTPETPRISRRKMLQERGTTLSAAKWKQIKNSLRAFGQGRKKERTQDYQKSAELLAELAAGGPAALMLASMFQRDEHGSRRIPVLLEQLRVSITDSEIDRYKEPGNATPGDRHIVFRIDLEYGSGANRMKWTIRRSLRDFANLHAKYKLHYQSEKLKGRGESSKEMPKFPKKAFPFLKGVRTIDEEEDDDEELPPDFEGVTTDTERPTMGPRYRSRASIGLTRRRSSANNADITPITPGGTLLFRRDKEKDRERDIRYPERQRKMLEIYLQKMIKFMLFRADANRLCKFLELSALGMRLASEGSYHGKEGFLIIRSAKGLDFRKAMTPQNIKSRHTPKWFLVRHSYIVCVDSPEGMHVYDVFLFDPDFTIQSSRTRVKEVKENSEKSSTAKGIAASSKEIAKHPQHHRLKLSNSERRLKLLARNERVLHQFEESIRATINNSPWCQPNRFESFAPVRSNCFAQWLVDGRDHMWVVSRALNQAKDVIYIHDWWLSPELYMRRPAAISQKWRLDRLLKRKAEQGVKVFVIVYRNIDAAIPIDSQYTKFSLLDLHPNIFVQRSPNQFRQNTFFWAHHEKLCIVDHTLAFVGGIDLCLGRWDTPQHILNDDKPTGFDAGELPKDADHCQLWPGKDYSNPRIQDFYDLNKPYEEMYDRSQVARMPWHDISMQVIGQPARDLTRHFVQRWNYILRQRKPTRPTPFLLPPPDFNPADLEALGLDGTCEVQLLRSAGPWSLGTPNKTEHSIMNAYVKMIEESEHFVYMENQFFISSCETEGATVYNKIGDALVERIARAAKNDEAWRAIIVIPLMPGFQNTVEQEGGTSVRLIMQYQFRSICRGDSSIFGRLRALGIEPEDFIQFYSLRQWGRIGPQQTLTTEQLYIHAKCIVVDDRIALIGSANINERSMLGNRDSEVAAVVRDTDMLWSRMNGQPYRVGRFAHTLRMRLMREHLGLDVDKIMEDAQAMESEHHKVAGKTSVRRPNSEGDDMTSQGSGREVDPMDLRGREMREDFLERNQELASFNHDVDWEQADNPNLRTNRKLTEDPRVTGKEAHKLDVEGRGTDHMEAIEHAGYGTGRDTLLFGRNKEVLITDLDAEGHVTLTEPRKHGEVARLPSYVVKLEMPNPPMPPKPTMARMRTDELGLTMLSQLPPLPELDDTDIGGPSLLDRAPTQGSGHHQHPLYSELKYPMVDRDCMQDPICDAFADETWHTVAENNTKIYRAVFRCMPDNLVRDWNDYHQYVAYEQRFNHLQGKDNNVDAQKTNADVDAGKRAGPPGVGAGAAAAQLKNLSKIPTDLEKTADGLKEMVKDVLGSKPEEKDAEEKEALRNWAVEANRAQMQRTGTDLTTRASGTIEEKVGLETVPEHDPLAARSSQESKSSDTANEKAGSQAVGYSEAINMNTQPGTVRRRRRATTRGSRRDFSASDDIMSLVEAEELLGKVQGHLIEWPYDW